MEGNYKSLFSIIDSHKMNNDMDICYDLYLILMDNNIEDEETLKKYEDSLFSVSDLKSRNLIRYSTYIQDRTHFDLIDQNILATLDEYEEKYKSLNDDVEKAWCLIKIYSLINWSNPFPYLTYKFIVADKM